MKRKVYKQWELPNNSKVILSGGEEITFRRMDGMYAQWIQDGELKIGNFEGFIKKDNYFIVWSKN